MQMRGIWICCAYPAFSFFHRRSENSQFRIFFPAYSAQRHEETQHVPRRQLPFFYIVFIPCPATARSPPEKGGVVIPDRGTLPETCDMPESRISPERPSGNLL
jgi:hypothetical protein